MNILFIIMLLMVASGLVWLVDTIFWAKKRKLIAKNQGREVKLPMIVDYSASLFPIFVIVLIVRAFVFQPYKVPTGSLEPTVMPGDYLLVTQYNYGLHFPVWRGTFLTTGKPEIGEVAVFKWPVNPKANLIKRVVGLPGDKISYINKVLYINGKEQKQTFVKNAVEHEGSHLTFQVREMQENLNGIKHNIYLRVNTKPNNFYNLVVPNGKYFMMGDNRDGSDDSRYWGFVPLKDFVGKARFIFFSWDGFGHRIKWDRVGDKLS